MNRRHFLAVALVICLLSACEQQPQANPKGGTTTVPVDTVATLPKTNAAGGEPIKEVLNQILTFAKAGDCAGMAPMLAYHEGKGSDTWHRGLNYEVLEEQLAAEKECAKLQVIVTGLQNHTFQEFATAQEAEGEWLVWKVKLQYQGEETDERAFAFLKVGDSYLLGDID
jgi:hypothetical protein